LPVERKALTIRDWEADDPRIQLAAIAGQAEVSGLAVRRAIQYNRAMSLGKTISFLGGGNMTEAMVCGLLKSGLSRPDDVWATDILPDRRTYLQSRFKIRTVGGNSEAAKAAEILVLCVEPQVLDEVLDQVRSVVSPEALVISVAAGYSIARVQAHLRPEARIVRVMPNTPSSVLEGMSAMAVGPNVSTEETRLAARIFESVGKVVEIDERLMDAVTGLSGSGPAYVYLMIEALADGGVKMGLPRPVAELLAAQTVLGSARMLLESGEHPGRLKDRVASPGGTTIAGLHKLEKGRLRATLIDAVEASAKRSKELGEED
jgi:pyrroline-5-carboxylate reductase